MKQPGISRRDLRTIRWMSPGDRISHPWGCVRICEPAGCCDPGRAAFQAEREAISDHGGMSVKKLLSASLRAIGLPALCLIGGALVITSQSARAHHSFSMFEYGSSI